jgi:ABC-type uncharacterized transport system substrate-binding protein
VFGSWEGFSKNKIGLVYFFCSTSAHPHTFISGKALILTNIYLKIFSESTDPI